MIPTTQHRSDSRAPGVMAFPILEDKPISAMCVAVMVYVRRRARKTVCTLPLLVLWWVVFSCVLSLWLLEGQGTADPQRVASFPLLRLDRALSPSAAPDTGSLSTTTSPPTKLEGPAS